MLAPTAENHISLHTYIYIDLNFVGIFAPKHIHTHTRKHLCKYEIYFCMHVRVRGCHCVCLKLSKHFSLVLVAFLAAFRFIIYLSDCILINFSTFVLSCSSASAAVTHFAWYFTLVSYAHMCIYSGFYPICSWQISSKCV